MSASVQAVSGVVTADPECRRFYWLSDELRQEARKSGNPALVGRVEDLLAPYLGATQRLPRSPIERLEAQRTLRHVLMATGCYGVVYGWYEAFKSPYGEDFEANLALYVRHLHAAADGFGWISGYDTVLECGCGAESLGLVLSGKNRRWIASDIYRPEALDRLMEMFAPGPNFEFRLINGISLEGIPDSSVDVVISRSFFEHLLIEDAKQHLRQAARVLRPGGSFVCLCPAGVGPPSDVTQEFPEYDTPHGLHIKEYRIGELAEELERCGFKPIHSRFLRLRGLGGLPPSLNRRNQIPAGVAGVLESLAAATWPIARRSPVRRKVWKKFWGHLGASNLFVIATRRVRPA